LEGPQVKSVPSAVVTDVGLGLLLTIGLGLGLWFGPT